MESDADLDSMMRDGIRRGELKPYEPRRGMLKGLAGTGGVITSAGLVLAGTFAVLGVLPLVQLTQIGFLVAFGMLLDTLMVRSVLVPALALDISPRTWWPSALSGRERHEEAVTQSTTPGTRTSDTTAV